MNHPNLKTWPAPPCTRAALTHSSSSFTSKSSISNWRAVEYITVAIIVQTNSPTNEPLVKVFPSYIPPPQTNVVRQKEPWPASRGDLAKPNDDEAGHPTIWGLRTKIFRNCLVHVINFHYVLFGLPSKQCWGITWSREAQHVVRWMSSAFEFNSNRRVVDSLGETIETRIVKFKYIE